MSIHPPKPCGCTDAVATSSQAGAWLLADRLPDGSSVLAIGGAGVATALAEAMTVSAGVTVDRASVALRVRGSGKQLALSGDVNVGSAHLRSSALKSPSAGAGGAGGAKKGPLADHPEIEAMRLDLRVHSGDGAIKVDVNNLPDLRLDVDLHVTGTAKKPSISGAPHGANVWSSFVLALAKLFS